MLKGKTHPGKRDEVRRLFEHHLAPAGRGADPHDLLVGAGGKMRYLKLATLEELRGDALAELVRAAVERSRRCGDPTRGDATRARD
jgi:hypothetical protein